MRWPVSPPVTLWAAVRSGHASPGKADGRQCVNSCPTGRLSCSDCSVFFRTSTFCLASTHLHPFVGRNRSCRPLGRARRPSRGGARWCRRCGRLRLTRRARLAGVRFGSAHRCDGAVAAEFRILLSDRYWFASVCRECWWHNAWGLTHELLVLGSVALGAILVNRRFNR